MKKNVGGLDKALRVVVGAVLVGATLAGMLPVWGYLGIVPLATGLIGWCPLYPLLGLSSCPMKKG